LRALATFKNNKLYLKKIDNTQRIYFVFTKNTTTTNMATKTKQMKNTKKNTKPNWVLTSADITDEPVGQKYPSNVFTFSTKELNAWTRENKIPLCDIQAIKAMRRRFKNRFYARDYRTRSRGKKEDVTSSTTVSSAVS